MTPVIAPSILSYRPGSLRAPTEKLAAAGADWIHLDVMDGQFVPPITFGAELARDLIKACPDTPFEAHLMTATPERHVGPFVDAGCKRVIFHAEASANAVALAEELRRANVGVGVAIKPNTSVEAVLPLVGKADLFLVMTVEPGWGGQMFMPGCLDKATHIRRLAPNVEIEVDGGIAAPTIGQAWRAGANVFVVGSYLVAADDLSQSIADLRARCV